MDPSQNLSSLYYLHPGENLGMILVTAILDGVNYPTWSRGMEHALLSKNKIKFINRDYMLHTNVKTQILHETIV